MKILRTLADVANELAKKLCIKHSEQTPKKLEVLDLVPHIFETVPMPLVQHTLSQLALGRTSNLPWCHKPLMDSGILSTLSYHVTSVYIYSDALCLDVEIALFRSNAAGVTSTGSIVLTMSDSGTVPNWVGHCTSIPVALLEEDADPADYFLSEEAELWLRVIYLTNQPVLHCTQYIRERSNKELIKKAISFIDKHNVKFNTVPHKQT